MKRTVIFLIIASIIGVGFYFLSRHNFLLFHLIVEDFTIVIGVLIFAIFLISRRFKQHSFMELLGPGVFVSSLVTFLHLATYKGMNIIAGANANLSTQLWIISNYILALSVFIAMWRTNRKTNYTLLSVSYVLFGIAGSVLCFLRLFPLCYIEDRGLTLFKQISEYAIIAGYLCALIPLFRNKQQHDYIDVRKTTLWISLLVLAEFMFTLYSDVYGIANFLGHYLRLMAFHLIFSDVVLENVGKPLTYLFGRLNMLSVTDGLTGLFNHRFFVEDLEKYRLLSLKDGKPMYLIIFDIDRFKEINDRYGHNIGDEVLRETADLLKSCIRSTDLAYRQGGDEFSLILYDTKDEVAKMLIDRIKGAFAETRLTDEKIQITLSGGAAKYAGESVQALINTADKLLYQAKDSGRSTVSVNF